MSSARKKLNKFKSIARHLYYYPGYIGRFRPDRMSWANAYYAISKLLHPRDYAKRRDMAEKLAVGLQEKFPHDKGHLLLDLRNHPMAEAALQYCDDVRQRSEFLVKSGESKKKFLRTLEFSIDNPEHRIIFELACDLALLAPVSEYLGSVPVLHRAGLTYSPNSFFGGESQYYHLDYEDYRTVKCQIYVEEVDEETGPLTIIPADESQKIYQHLRREGAIKRRLEWVEDDTIYRASERNDGLQLCGPRGTAILADTCNCYHYGSRPAKKPRNVLFLHYATAFSIDLPQWGRRGNNISWVEDYPLEKREVLNQVLGLFPKNIARVRENRLASLGIGR